MTPGERANHSVLASVLVLVAGCAGAKEHPTPAASVPGPPATAPPQPDPGPPPAARREPVEPPLTDPPWIVDREGIVQARTADWVRVMNVDCREVDVEARRRAILAQYWPDAVIVRVTIRYRDGQAVEVPREYEPAAFAAAYLDLCERYDLMHVTAKSSPARVDDQTVRVALEFLQEFVGSRTGGYHYRDFGYKTLTYALRGREWRIVRESWRIYEGTEVDDGLAAR
jgi:hypothetical protein